MLRFDIPNICGNTYRMNAFWVMTTMVAMYFMPMPIGLAMLSLLAFESFVRGFINPHKGVFYNFNSKICRSMGIKEVKMNAGSKMFTDKLVFIASMVIFGLYTANSFGFVNTMWQIPTIMMGIAAAVDTVIGFCVACWSYGLFYKVRDKLRMAAA